MCSRTGLPTSGRTGKKPRIEPAAALRNDEARAKQDLYLTVVGEAAGLLHDHPGAARLIENIVRQAESLLKRGASLRFPRFPGAHDDGEEGKTAGQAKRAKHA